MEPGFQDISKDMIVTYHDGEPCDHPGCKNHVSHPCENCGRIMAQGEVKIRHEAILVA